MNQLEIIDSLLSGSNNIEQMGRLNPGADATSVFGSGSFVVCGELQEKTSYIYVYDDPLSHNSYKAKADAIVMNDNNLIFLYAVAA